MSAVAVSVEGLSKLYHLGAQTAGYTTLRESLVAAFQAPIKRIGRTMRSAASRQADEGLVELWALRDVSFQLDHGEVLGIIGRNGAGKSTLLKVLSRITEPTFGRVSLRGRVGSLLEVGTGFHPELTGRENIFLNGAILGMSQREVRVKLDAIVDFAEIERFLDTPVKRYSSGMYMRLAFSVAASLEPDILVIDEVLAVGDARFQNKCLGKMGEIRAQGRTVLFVSHNLAAVQNICSRCLMLDSGSIAAEGPPETVIRRFLDDLSQSRELDERNTLRRSSSGRVRCQTIGFQRSDGSPASAFQSGEALQVAIDYRANSLPLDSQVVVSLTVQDGFDQTLFTCSNELTGEIATDWPSNGTITCSIQDLPLVESDYHINVKIAVNGVVADWLEDAASFRVVAGDFYNSGKLPPSSQGQFLVRHRWDVR